MAVAGRPDTGDRHTRLVRLDAVGDGQVELVRAVALAANTAVDAHDALHAGLDAVCDYLQLPVGAIWMPGSGADELWEGRFVYESATPAESALRAELTRPQALEGVLGALVRTGSAGSLWSLMPGSGWEGAALDGGLEMSLAFSIRLGGETVAVIHALGSAGWSPQPGLRATMETIAIQLGRVIERERAFVRLAAREARTRSIIDTSSDGFVAVDRDGFIRDTNPRLEDLLGWSRSELIGRPFADTLIPPPLRGHRLCEVANWQPTATNGVAGAAVEVAALHRDGTAVLVEWSVSTASDAADDGSFRGHAFVRDVRERHLAQAQLTASRDLFADAERLAGLGSWRYDTARQQVACSPQMLAMLGHRDGDTVSPEVFFAAVDPDHRGELGAVIQATLQHGRPLVIEHRLGPEGEARIWVRTEARRASDAATMLVGTTLDIDAEHRMRAEIAETSRRDPLTGHANRHSLLEIITELKHRSGPPVLTALVDLDEFRTVNARFGTIDGDRLLRAVADRLAARAGDDTTIGRLGADRFAVVTTTADHTRLLAEIAAVFEQPFAIGSEALTVTATIGWASSGPDEDADRVIANADIALHLAKSRGIAVLAFDGQMHQHTLEQLTLRHDLARAITNDALEVHYQPVISLEHHGRWSSVEALARWEHPSLGNIPPPRFIDLAERHGHIHALGQFVLDRACRQLAHWGENFVHPPHNIAVNLSPAQLADPALPRMVSATLVRYGLDPDQLTLEITESLVADPHDDATRRRLHELADLGLHLSIDDFGTGHSSLARLAKFPVHELKIDRVFVRDIVAANEEAPLLETLVQMAHRLGLRIVVEGIETNSQLALAMRLGVHAVQGYLLSRPQPAHILDHLLTDPAS